MFFRAIINSQNKMILSVSRRTDIPAFYSEWFIRRIKEGFVYVRNPFNTHQIRKIYLNPSNVDCIVFWTKNPKPLLGKLHELKDYNFYFQITLNPYSHDLEIGVPKKTGIINSIKVLSEAIGPGKIVWRYDPIIINKKYDEDYHLHYYRKLVEYLHDYSQMNVISFLDIYKKIENRIDTSTHKGFSDQNKIKLVDKLKDIADKFQVEIRSCAENLDLNIEKSHCIDKELIEKLIGHPTSYKKDKNQRPECGCIESVDIGEYNTCQHNCTYCYANFSENSINNKVMKHNPLSPLLVGEFDPINDTLIDKGEIAKLF